MSTISFVLLGSVLPLSAWAFVVVTYPLRNKAVRAALLVTVLIIGAVALINNIVPSPDYVCEVGDTVCRHSLQMGNVPFGEELITDSLK